MSGAGTSTLDATLSHAGSGHALFYNPVTSELLGTGSKVTQHTKRHIEPIEKQQAVRPE